MVSTRAFVLVTSIGLSAAKQWAVLVAGSDGFFNYRHQADVCHAYHIVSQTIPAENIVVMMTDTVADDKFNPFPGQLFNKPTPAGTPGVDVRKNCAIDYKGVDVTPDNFLGVLNGTASGKTLESGKEDDVFVFFADHGAPGLISFPTDYVLQELRQLHKQELQSAIDNMYKQKRFKKLVFYLETCESGSMFQGLNTPGVYAVSAAGPDEPSYGAYCGQDATVDGTEINQCLGDVFSVSWMEHVDSKGTHETLEAQFKTVKELVTQSSAEQWGDLSFKTDMVSEFLGDVQGGDIAATPVGAISAREIHLSQAYRRYLGASTPDERFAAAEVLEHTIKDQIAAETAYERFLELVYPNDMEKRAAARLDSVPADFPDCELSTRRAFGKYGQFDSTSAFSLQFHRYIVNVCADIRKSGVNVEPVGLARLACTVDSAVV